MSTMMLAGNAGKNVFGASSRTSYLRRYRTFKARVSSSSSASANLRQTLDRIDEVQAKLNAVTVTYEEEDLKREADRIDALSSESKAALRGVPVLVKDALNVKGLQTTLGRGGSPKFDEPKPTDAAVVSCLRKAGALVVGKTNMPRDGIDVQTFNSRFGVTGNVFALERTAGGSSGGSAVAVAAEVVPVRAEPTCSACCCHASI